MYVCIYWKITFPPPLSAGKECRQMSFAGGGNMKGGKEENVEEIKGKATDEEKIDIKREKLGKWGKIYAKKRCVRF
jgi:hypothetical protein